MSREERMKAILEHPAYVRADLDLDRIGSNEMRGTMVQKRRDNRCDDIATS